MIINNKFTQKQQEIDVLQQNKIQNSIKGKFREMVRPRPHGLVIHPF